MSVHEPAPWRAGDIVGSLGLGTDPSEGVSWAEAEVLSRLIDVATETDVEIYDPQRSALVTKSDVKVRSRGGTKTQHGDCDPS